MYKMSKTMSDIIVKNQLPEPTVIILKNSVEQGKMPTPEQLEVGELGLGLHAGEESIWVKNSDGVVVDLRVPRVDNFWGDFLLEYETLEEFNADLEAGKISDTSIAFIKGSRQAWTKGTFFALSEEEINKLIDSKVLLFPSMTSELTSESTSEEIAEIFGGAENFVKLTEKIKDQISIASLRVDSGKAIVPVSIQSSIIECETQCKNVLVLEWIYSGKYYSEKIILNSFISEFSVEREFTESTFIEVVEKIDELFNTNLELVEPKINGTWDFYNNAFEPITITPSPNKYNPVIENGYKAVFKGVYTWTSEDGKKDPTGVVKGSFWDTLTGTDVSSDIVTSPYYTEDATISIKLEAPKTGFMVRGEDVVRSTGVYDYTEDTRSVTFAHRLFYGVSTKGKDLVEYDIKSLKTSELITEHPKKTLEHFSTEMNEYAIIAYPKVLGELDSIYQDGIRVIKAFNKVELEITNGAGIVIDYIIYVTNNPGAFTDVELEFK